MTLDVKKSLVRRHWLFLISGILWSVAGSILLWRSLIWLSIYPPEEEVIIGMMGIILAIVFFFSSFIKIARKNANRIFSLPDKASILRFTSRRGYIMIAFMITFGILLRNSPIPKQYLSVLYTAMGVALEFGSIFFYKTWLNVLKEV